MGKRHPFGRIAIARAGVGFRPLRIRRHEPQQSNRGATTCSASHRDEPKDVDALVARARKGGPEFFSSQIIIQEEQSGSETFDLCRTHGLSSAKSYRNVTAWACEAGDYPIVYFVGFRVREIADGTIAVSREKDIVNVISLHALDPDLKKHLQVKMMDSGEILCRDLGEGCIDRIYYDRE